MKMTFKVILVGGLLVFFAVVSVVVFAPVALWNPPQTTVAIERSLEQLLGRELFYGNGCNYCHTQYVRDIDNGMGPTSQGGDYVFDNPMILGSERTGPDLSYIGRKRSQQWEIDHLIDPRKYSPMSIMPSFSFLTDAQAHAISEYLFSLGDRAAAERMIISPAPYLQSRPTTMSAGIQSTDPNAPPQGWPTFKDSGLYEGKQIFTSRCLTCHGCAGNGLGSYGGTLIVTPANFKVDPFRSMPDDQWFWHVSEGVQGSVMPPWKESLTPAQRWNVIRYVQEVYAHPIERDPNEGDPPAEYQKTNPLPNDAANLDAGKRIWTRECMVCHGDAATGMGPYRAGVEPVPPDFSQHADYVPYVDADYFWRISEGVPWTAMPTWKLQYSETQRWQLVHYIRSMFTQTEKQPPQPAKGKDFDFTTIIKQMRAPVTVSFEAGKAQFLALCVTCHGPAGDGTGPDGAYLDPKPADLRKLPSQVNAGQFSAGTVEGGLLARINSGVQITAMPAWSEFLMEADRWNDVSFVRGAFIDGSAKMERSVMGDGSVPLQYVRTDPGIFESEIATIVPADGKPLYEKWCATCHGADGLGKGPGTRTLVSGSPAAFPKGMSNPYMFYRIREGVPNTMMYGFRPVLTETEVWDLTAYLTGLTGGKWGG
jgi:cbb3-type cytochrome c oxidase subunit II